ncbi:MAG TPA: BrnT family toxin [Thermoanaerobaculia bacterium]|nr:BrnT family toxin [Thermoanaerobaculia bacterium]
MQFSWDPAKARANQRKHGVSFEEAATVFIADPLARIHDDPDHSVDELREIIIGVSAAGRLLLISFIEHAETVRIISARVTDPWERRRYEENR